jgi:hypothetical protein
METRHILLLALLGLCTLPAAPSTAEALGTAFTYQGQLSAGGAPANGDYDFTFALFNTGSTNAGQVGGTLTNFDVGVSNGLFTVNLDFGAVFTGNATWLAIGVRTNGGAGFIALSPLQELTPSPYAIMANSASNLLGELPAAQLSGTIPLAQLNGVAAANMQVAGTIYSTGGSVMAGNQFVGSGSNAWSYSLSANQVGLSGEYPTMFVGSNPSYPIWLSSDLITLGISWGQIQGYAYDAVHNTHVIVVEPPASTGCPVALGYVIANDLAWRNQSGPLTILTSNCLNNVGVGSPASFCLHNGSVCLLTCSGTDPNTDDQLLFCGSEMLSFYDERTLQSNAPSIAIVLPNGMSNVLNSITFDGQGNMWLEAQTLWYDRGLTPTNCIVEFSSRGIFLQSIPMTLPIMDAQSIMFDPYDPNTNQLNLYVVGYDAAYNTQWGGPSIFRANILNNTVGICSEIQKMILPGFTLFTGGSFVANPNAV